MFADDSTAIIKSIDRNIYQDDMNSTISDILSWFDKNNLVINLKKTKIMHFHQRTLVPKVNIRHSNCDIEEVEKKSS